MFAELSMILRLETTVSDRVFKRVGKKVMHEGLLFWHLVFTPRKFTRQAYALYPGAFAKTGTKPKKHNRRPLFKRGHLQEHILRQPVKPIGPMDRVRINLKYGRPGRLGSEDEITASIFIVMEQTGVDYKTAAARVYATAGYAPRTKELFGNVLKARHPSETQAVLDVVSDRMTEELNDPRNAERRVKRIAG